MLRALDISTSGLVAQRIRLDAISSNIANMSSVRNEKGEAKPYQERFVVFQPDEEVQAGDGAMGVKVAEIRTETTTSGVGSRRDTMTFVYPEMEFDYEYQGRAHRSDRIVFAEINWPPEQARGYIAAHPAGTRLTAWVDPGRPERAVVERGLAEHRGKYVTSLVIAAILLAMGVVGFVLAPLLRRVHW